MCWEGANLHSLVRLSAGQRSLGITRTVTVLNVVIESLISHQSNASFIIYMLYVHSHYFYVF